MKLRHLIAALYACLAACGGRVESIETDASPLTAMSGAGFLIRPGSDACIATNAASLVVGSQVLGGSCVGPRGIFWKLVTVTGGQELQSTINTALCLSAATGLAVLDTCGNAGTTLYITNTIGAFGYGYLNITPGNQGTWSTTTATQVTGVGFITVFHLQDGSGYTVNAKSTNVHGGELVTGPNGATAQNFFAFLDTTTFRAQYAPTIAGGSFTAPPNKWVQLDQFGNVLYSAGTGCADFYVATSQIVSSCSSGAWSTPDGEGSLLNMNSGDNIITPTYQ